MASSVALMYPFRYSILAVSLSDSLCGIPKPDQMIDGNTLEGYIWTAFIHAFCFVEELLVCIVCRISQKKFQNQQNLRFLGFLSSPMTWYFDSSVREVERFSTEWLMTSCNPTAIISWEQNTHSNPESFVDKCLYVFNGLMDMSCGLILIWSPGRFRRNTQNKKFQQQILLILIPVNWGIWVIFGMRKTKP